MLEALLRSRVADKLISYFMQHQNREVYLREISRDIQEPASAVQRELEKLESFGLVSSERRGNHKFFKVREEFPLLPEFRSLFVKTEGAVEYLKERLGSIDGVQLAFAYGEFAANPEAGILEIYLVVIGLPDHLELEKHVKEMQIKLGRRIFYTQYSPSEFKRLLEAKDPALSKTINGEKIILVANVSDAE